MEVDDIETLQFSDDDEEEEDNNYLNQQLHSERILSSYPYFRDEESEQQELQFLFELVAQDRKRHQDYLNTMLSHFPVGHALNNLRINNEEEHDSRGYSESKPTHSGSGLEALKELLENASNDELDEESKNNDLVQPFEAV